MIKSDFWIKEKCQTNKLFSPYFTSLQKEFSNNENLVKAISYGVTSYGYDCRLDDKLEIFQSPNNGYSKNFDDIIDPKKFEALFLYSAKINIDKDGSRYFLLPKKKYALGLTKEIINIPRDTLALCLGKSTYCRSGIFINTSPMEPEWRGQLVLEIYNASECSVKLYIDEGICQMIFLGGDRACEVSYNDRSGKYQDQKEIVMAKV